MLHRLGLALGVLCALIALLDVPSGPATAATQEVGHTARPFIVAAPLSSRVAGYTPTDLNSIYGVPVGVSSTATVAIIAAGRNPQLAAELATYRAQFGLPACPSCLSEVNQNGAASPLPGEVTDKSGTPLWHLEIALDAEMVTALCPSCHVLVVDANSADVANLAAAADAAVGLGAQYVSMSFGAGEWAGETSLDSHLAKPGVVYVAATGDNGYGTVWPAVSPNVVAVGGATVVGSASTGWSATTWNGAGSGCSHYEQRSVVQGLLTGLLSGLLSGACTGRVDADLAGVADPQHGVAVYTQGTWYAVGGTSAAAPAVAALFALAGQHSGQTLYGNQGSFIDIATGSTQGCPASAGLLCTAAPGWDGPTGLGLPYGLVAFGGAAAPPPPLAARSAMHRVSGPRMSGRPQVGRRLVAHPGAFIDARTLLPVRVQVKYQWYTGHRKLRGATRASIVVARQLRSQKVWFRATISSPGYVPVAVSSSRKAVR